MDILNGDDINNDQERLIVAFVNGVWVDQRLQLKPPFDHILRTVYNVVPKFLDFVKKGDEAVDEVNSWARSSTKGLIPKIIGKGNIDQNTMILLANALYFKGTWDTVFDPELTHDRKFYLHNRKGVNVPFMAQYSEYYDYASFESFKLIRLPYKTSGDKRRKLSMYVFLPHEEDGLPELIQHFGSDPCFVNQNFTLEETKIDMLQIPKFKMTTDYSVQQVLDEQLKPIVPEINVADFVVNGGDFPERHINILQKCYVEVDESGTRAAAISVDYCAYIGDDMKKRPPQINFIADHPFLFMIKEDMSGLALFIGALINPLVG